MVTATEARIQLCGNFVVSVGGERRERELPGRQGRVLLAYLALARMRPSTRYELIEAVWGEDAPEAADAGLSALLSKLRKVVQIEGSHELRLSLPVGASVDVEVTTNALHLAESAVSTGNWDAVWGPAHVAMYIAERPFLAGEDLPWIEDERHRLEGIKLTAYECLAALGPHAGGAGLATAERAARRLVAAAPFRETGHLHLIEILEARGNRAEALRAYDVLRCLLRDELGTAPGPMLQSLHQRLLRIEEASTDGAAPEPRLPRPRVERSLIGREAELKRLRPLLAGAAGGRQRTLLLTGEPGIGKTRLAIELCRMAYADGMEVLFGRCDHQALVPYQPLVEALRQHISTCPDDRLARQLTGCSGELAALLPEVRAQLPATASDGDRLRLFDSVVELLRAAARDRPLVVAIDDLHAAEEGTLRLLKHVGGAPGDAPLLLLLTCRDGEEPDIVAELRRTGPLEQVQLRGLEPGGVSDLVESSTGALPPEALVRAIWRRTAGNPFFVEELIGNLLESGALTVEDGGWSWDLSNEEIVLSPGIKEVVERRLSRLSERCRDILAAAAVAGPGFRLEPLAEALDADADEVLQALQEALTARVIVEYSGGELSFGHPLMRETIYEDLPSSRRQSLHGRIAEALEATAPAGSASVAELAHHLTRAGPAIPAETAIEYSLKAADEAAQQLDHEQVVRVLDQALELLPTGDEDLRREIMRRRAMSHTVLWALTYERGRFEAASGG
jgi:DNA-binding SARP family transcriptional activator